MHFILQSRYQSGCLIVLLILSLNVAAQKWTMSEYQPNIQQGGRASTIAVHPQESNRIIVATETGGLFRSGNGGDSWEHLDNLPCFFTNSVAYVPSNPDIVLVTTRPDFKMKNGGGVWRSTNGGGSFTQCNLNSPFTSSVTGYEISIAADTKEIYVATNHGVFMSRDNGASWQYQKISDDFTNVYSVLALGNNRVIAAGSDGIRWSQNKGNTWTAPKGTTVIKVAERDIHALAKSSFFYFHAFVVDENGKLFYTENSGMEWFSIPVPAGGGGGCGGIAFIKAVETGTVPKDQAFYLYYGNRCSMYRQLVQIDGVGKSLYTDEWVAIKNNHDDVRDIAFDNKFKPLLLSSDGGIEKATDKGAWKFTGGGAGGFNALQLYEVTGQYIQDAGRQDLYIGTQDNHLWAAEHGVNAWIQAGNEGWYIQAQRIVSASTRSTINYVVPNNPTNIISGPLFSNVANWPDPPGPVVGNPVIIKTFKHIQRVVADAASTLSNGLAVTTNLGKTWRQYARFTVNPLGIPKVARVGTEPIKEGGKGSSTIIYQAYTDPASGNNVLMRIVEQPNAEEAKVFYPAMNNFGSMGFIITAFPWYPVYSIDPGDPYHIIAPDIKNQRVMETRDGGENWTEMPELTRLVTGNGQLRFSMNDASILTSISFCPQNPNLVLAGTMEGGIFSSDDNGKTWKAFKGTDRIPYITSFFWIDANDVVVSSYGRGLWRLQNLLIIPDARCLPPCGLRPVERFKEILKFDRGILVYDGRILDVKTQSGIVKEVIVTTGSSVVFAGDSLDNITGIKITKASAASLLKNKMLLQRPADTTTVLKGLALNTSGKLEAMVLGDKPMPMADAVIRPDVQGSTISPLEGKPYIQVITGKFTGLPAASPGKQVQVSGNNFQKGERLALYINDKKITDSIIAGPMGNFTIKISAPANMGLQQAEIRSRTNKVMSAAKFLIVNEAENQKRRIIAPAPNYKPSSRPTSTTIQKNKF